MKAIGLLYLILLYIACYVFICMVRLAVQGFKSMQKDRAEQPPAEEEKKNEPQPVYYIVEKKKARSKATYSQPREIKFSDEAKK